jgi:hypothetical protein
MRIGVLIFRCGRHSHALQDTMRPPGSHTDEGAGFAATPISKRARREQIEFWGRTRQDRPA